MIMLLIHKCVSRSMKNHFLHYSAWHFVAFDISYWYYVLFTVWDLENELRISVGQIFSCSQQPVQWLYHFMTWSDMTSYVIMTWRDMSWYCHTIMGNDMSQNDICLCCCCSSLCCSWCFIYNCCLVCGQLMFTWGLLATTTEFYKVNVNTQRG